MQIVPFSVVDVTRTVTRSPDSFADAAYFAQTPPEKCSVSVRPSARYPCTRTSPVCDPEPVAVGEEADGDGEAEFFGAARNLGSTAGCVTVNAFSCPAGSTRNSHEGTSACRPST